MYKNASVEINAIQNKFKRCIFFVVLYFMTIKKNNAHRYSKNIRDENCMSEILIDYLNTTYFQCSERSF